MLDAPDIDSVVTRNRELATQLLAAADMWLFVTTAARYADAVPWEFLRTAATRGTAVAVVLDRVPPEATDEVRAHLATMLTEQGLGDAPLFVVPETTAYDALLPPDVVDPIRTWLHGIADDAEVRAAVVRHTLAGAIQSMAARVFELAAPPTPRPKPCSACVATSTRPTTARSRWSTRRATIGSLLRGEVPPDGRSSWAPGR